MPKRSSSSKRLDANQIARNVVALATGEEQPHKKNPAAVSLGRRGGLKGGKARAAFFLLASFSDGPAGGQWLATSSSPNCYVHQSTPMQAVPNRRLSSISDVSDGACLNKFQNIQRPRPSVAMNSGFCL